MENNQSYVFFLLGFMQNYLSKQIILHSLEI